LSTIQNADHIVVLDEGRIVETGTHHQLLARGGHYSALVRQQCEAGTPAPLHGIEHDEPSRQDQYPSRNLALS
jgi:ABC-type glutathione transport system ATPase component